MTGIGLIKLLNNRNNSNVVGGKLNIAHHKKTSFNVKRYRKEMQKDRPLPPRRGGAYSPASITNSIINK